MIVKIALPKKPFHIFKSGELDKSQDLWTVKFVRKAAAKTLMLDVPDELPYCQYLLQTWVSYHASYIFREGDRIVARNGNLNDCRMENLLLLRNVRNIDNRNVDRLFQNRPEFMCHYEGSFEGTEVIGGNDMSCVFIVDAAPDIDIFGREDDRGVWVPNKPLDVVVSNTRVSA